MQACMLRSPTAHCIRIRALAKQQRNACCLRTKHVLHDNTYSSSEQWRLGLIKQKNTNPSATAPGHYKNARKPTAADDHVL
jgi:hypothetical protein